MSERIIIESLQPVYSLLEARNIAAIEKITQILKEHTQVFPELELDRWQENLKTVSQKYYLDVQLQDIPEEVIELFDFKESLYLLAGLVQMGQYCGPFWYHALVEKDILFVLIKRMEQTALDSGN